MPHDKCRIKAVLCAQADYNGKMQTEFHTVALFGKYDKRASTEHLCQLADFLIAQGLRVFVESRSLGAFGMSDYPLASLDEIGEHAD